MGYTNTMKLLPYKLSETKDKLTSCGGLLIVTELMERLKLPELINQHFPAPKSNRGFQPATYVQTLILMQHSDNPHLDDVRYLQNEADLRQLMGLEQIPQRSALSNWLHRIGKDPSSKKSFVAVNQQLLQAGLHHCKSVTLDIDASEIIANKTGAKWTYKKNKGYMPMFGHIAETGQIVGCDFREGNASPARDNFEFIQECESNLPADVSITAFRADAASYQVKVIQHCEEKKIKYAIRAKSSPKMKREIEVLTEDDWQPMLDKQGQPVDGQSTCRIPYYIGDYEKPFTLVIQRTEKKEEAEPELDLGLHEVDDALIGQKMIYRAIATNRESSSDSAIIHWYNQRGEASENRIKELKLDFGGDTLPCSDFDANALYLLICTLAFNLFALLRQMLPGKLAYHRVTTIRWKLYAMAGKIVKTAGQYFLKLQSHNKVLLEQVFTFMRGFNLQV